MSMILFYESLFWSSTLTLFWIYLGYRLILIFLNVFMGKNPYRDYSLQPTVSILVPTYNEIVHVARKIEECLAFDYPKDKLEIIVIDSNSSDGTPGVAKTYGDRDVRLIQERIRRGKACAIATGMKAAKGDIVIVTDTNCFLQADAVKRVVAYFADAKVGAVTAAFQNSTSGDPSLTRLCKRYWSIDNAMKNLESRLSSAIGLVGELAAVRRSIFANADVADWALARGADDTSMGLFIIRNGYRIRFAPDVLVLEPSAGSCSDYFLQKVRVITQNLWHAFDRSLPGGRRFGFYSSLIFPTRRMISPLSPILLVVAFCSTTVLSGYQGGIYDIALVLQITLYGLGVLGLTTGLGRLPGTRSAAFFVFFNMVIGAAWINVLRNKDFSVWNQIASTRYVGEPPHS